jgi:hypothetical protein
MSHYDTLTGLLSCSSFYEILENTIRTSRRKHQHFALLFIDLADQAMYHGQACRCRQCPDIRPLSRYLPDNTSNLFR